VPTGVTDSWRERALDRSLRSARERAVARSERFIRAATDLLNETGDLDFTVSDLVERSGLSLRAFYQHFASKDDLILAVFEEGLRSYVAGLRFALDPLSDPVEKLERYVAGFHAAGGETNRPASAAVSRFLLSLTSDRSPGVARVLEPQVQLLREILQAGVASGAFRRDISVPAMTVLVTQTLTSAVESNLLGPPDSAEAVSAADLWAYCLGAVSPPARRPARTRVRRRPRRD
jgi:AcrR family transcriptional regulator